MTTSKELIMPTKGTVPPQFLPGYVKKSAPVTPATPKPKPKPKPKNAPKKPANPLTYGQ